MNLLLKQVLFRLPKALPDNFSSIAFHYKALSAEWCDAVFNNSSPDNRHPKRNHAENLIFQSSTLWSLIMEILPRNTFEEGSDSWGIAQIKWREWLESLWACDGDALCLLACPSAVPEKLPLVWAPAKAFAPNHDAHVHLSALPPSSLLWGTIMALGITGESGAGHLHSAFENSSSLKEVARLARLILSTLQSLDQIEDTDFPNGIINIYADAWGSIGTNSSSTEIACRFERTFPILKLDAIHDALTCSNCFGVNTSMTMLVEERRIVSQTLMRCKSDRIEWYWLLDLLVLYWQCKGEWLLSIQGDGNQTNGSLYSFKGQAMRASSFAPKPGNLSDEGHRRRFDELVTSGFQAHLNARKAPLRIDLRIALAGMSELRAASAWLDVGLKGSDTKIFIGLKRRNDLLGRGDRAFSEALSEQIIDDYFERLSKFENIKERVHGIDVFGFEATTCWSDYHLLMKHAAEHVKRLSGNCIVTFHCGEDPVCSLKGILDMWRNVNELSIIGECRISHALALLSPQSYNIDSPIDNRLWYEMQLAASQLLRYARSNRGLANEAPKLESLWSTVESCATGSKYGMTVPLNSIDMAEVFERFREAITKDLISRGVVIEVCPTSNWRIGNVRSPLVHPIRYWHEKGGKWLIGTDDPCFIPCSLESESANVAFSLQ